MDYSIQDFLQAQLETHEYRYAHPDLQAYYAQKAQAFRAAFHLSLDASERNRVQPPAPTAVPALFDSALDSYVAIQTPFSGYFETPRGWDTTYEQYGPEFEQQAEHLRALHRNFMLALLNRWYGPVNAHVSSADLFHYGFDDRATAPDRDAYL